MEKFEEAIDLLKSKPFLTICEEIPRPTHHTIRLFDTYPLFKRLGVTSLYFRIISAQAAHLPCDHSSIVRSKMDLPYPKLPLFVQSAMDSRDFVTLTDVVDGMDLSEKWGLDSLDLTYTKDTCWAEWANERIQRVNPEASFGLIPTIAFDRKKKWLKLVQSKQTRAGWKYPPEQYATRFRRHGTTDPTTRDRTHV